MDIIKADTVEQYNRFFGFHTQHPLVSVVHFDGSENQPDAHKMTFGFYALFLKKTVGCTINYGKTMYDYDDETVVCFAPGQTIAVHRIEDGPAPMDEIPVIWEIILQAKAQMYREGKHQWDENYPTVPILENDVRRGWGYVLVPEKDTPVQNVYDEATPFFNDHTGTDNGTSRQDIIAYGAVVFDGEPAYKGLWDGQWLSEQPYVVLHRLAVADRWKRQGMAVRYIQAVCGLALSRGIRSFKVDTNYDNFYMQRVFSRLGFTYCGRIRYDAGERMAYEKRL